MLDAEPLRGHHVVVSLSAADVLTAPEQLDGLTAVLDLIRSGEAVTRPELTRVAGLGRSIVTQRVAHLLQQGVVEETRLGESTGGRAPRELAIRSAAGLVLVAPLGAVHLSVGLADLTGALHETREESTDIALGPERVLARVEKLFDQLMRSHKHVGGELYGIGIGLPGPVEFGSGRPVRPPIMPGWDGYDVRGRLQRRYDVPVWVDNDVNLMALGELRAGAARGERDVIYVKVGTGIGAGLISGGRLHRGAKGCAGDIGHVAIAEGAQITCRCGNTGCLEAVAGGAALARAATVLAQQGRSPYLSHLLEHQSELSPRDLTRAAGEGDAVAVELITRAGRLVGETVATLINFFDPSLLLLGGSLASESDLLLAAVRETVYRRSLPLATRDLRIETPRGQFDSGLMGATSMVTDGLFGRAGLGIWLPHGSPAGHPEIAAAATA